MLLSIHTEPATEGSARAAGGLSHVRRWSVSELRSVVTVGQVSTSAAMSRCGDQSELSTNIAASSAVFGRRNGRGGQIVRFFASVSFALSLAVLAANTAGCTYHSSKRPSRTSRSTLPPPVQRRQRRP